MTVHDDSQRRSKVLRYLGHYNILVLTTVMLLTASDDATNQRNQLLNWSDNVGWILWVTAVVVNHVYHEEHLCEWCVASSPLNPQAAVNRWLLALRLHHAIKLKITMLISYVVWALVIHNVYHTQPAWVNYTNAALCVLILIVYLPTWQHHRLYPWCPWCHWRGGGDHEISPEVPTPTMSR